MIELLSKVLVANGLNPDSFTASAGNEKIFGGELPAGRVVETWMKLAKAASETKYWPIMVVEQQQILTTQNLAVLFKELGLTAALRPQLGDLAKECFKWICQRQQMKIDTWHAKLIMVKNSVYAWRQMIFFLGLLPSL